MFVLDVQVAGEASRRVRLDRPSITLGRSSVNDLPLADRTLSRQHARIQIAAGGVPVLADLESRNGTSVNGVRISEPTALRPGDRIVLGETVIDVDLESVARVVLDAPEREPSVESTLYRSSRDLVTAHRREPSSATMGAEELARLASSLRILNEVSVELLADLPEGALASLLLEKLFAYLHPDRGLLLLSDASGELKPAAVRFAEGIDPSDIRLSRTLVQAVVGQKNGVLMIDTQTDERLISSDSIRLQGVTSCVAAPLVAEDRAIGLVYLEARLGRKCFVEEDLRLLGSLANTAAIKVQNLRLQGEAEARRYFEREMALAWEAQRRLLPDHAPTLPATELFGRTIPSRTVSGDYYDFFEREGGTVDVVVADVCGKGMAASLLAASVQAGYQAWASDGLEPDVLCTRLNDLAAKKAPPGKFITLFAALYEPLTGSFRYTNAGHNPGLVVRSDGRTELLEAHGIPLGLFPGRTYGSGTVRLAGGDLLVLYTDGLTEAFAPDGEEFGMGRLTAVLVAARNLPLEEIETAVADALNAHAKGTPFADDRTLVLLRRT